MKADPNFRADPDRAIYITGVIDDAMCSKLIREINTLRSVKDKPITAYINSPGGNIRVIDILLGLLKEEDQDGIKIRLITVVSGDAASAAAMLLAIGDYAVAYPHSIVHYHGVRFGEIDDLTTEKASISAKSLAARNREIALNVANAAIKRLAHRYSTVSGEFSKIREDPEMKDYTDIECFLVAIQDNLSDTAFFAAKESVDKTIQVDAIAEAAFQSVKFSHGESQLDMDLKVLRGLLDYEAQTMSHKFLDEGAMEQLTSDYLLLTDYFGGEHGHSLGAICEDFGFWFFRNEEFDEYEEAEKTLSAENLSKWLRDKVEDRVRSFWYFTVLLCRRLHEGENRLDAEDAYWLGLVDEVVGTQLTGFRSFLESQADLSSPELPGLNPPPNVSEPSPE